MITQTGTSAKGVTKNDSGAQFALEDARNSLGDVDGVAMVDAPMNNSGGDDYNIATPYAGDAVNTPHGNVSPPPASTGLDAIAPKGEERHTGC